MISRILSLALTFTFVALVLGPIDSAHTKESITVNVKVKKTSLRKDKQFFARTIAEARFGDRVEIIKKDKDWHYVSFKGKKGWVHQSAISIGGGGGALSLSFGRNDDLKNAATSDEVALAGKGFNSQVEGEYKKDNKRSNYAAVDRMEKVTASENELLRFVEEGGLAKEPNE